nr:hypothetical protein [Tanacetum cinerariifolium]
MSDKLVELNNTVLGLQANISEKQLKILELEECLRKKDFKNEHLKSEAVNVTTFQNLQVRVEEHKSENKGLTFLVIKLTKARERGKLNLKQRDEKIYALNLHAYTFLEIEILNRTSFLKFFNFNTSSLQEGRAVSE